MKQEHQDDLDRLLSRAPMPQAPAWFKARLMARLRREEAKPLPWWKKYAKLLTVCSAAAIVLFLGLTWNMNVADTRVAGDLPSSSTNIAIHIPAMDHVGYERVKEEKVVAALNAFVSYQEENQVWSDSVQ